MGIPLSKSLAPKRIPRGKALWTLETFCVAGRSTKGKACARSSALILAMPASAKRSAEDEDDQEEYDEGEGSAPRSLPKRAKNEPRGSQVGDRPVVVAHVDVHRSFDVWCMPWWKICLLALRSVPCFTTCRHWDSCSLGSWS
jgi:hypothetical protein